MSVKDSQITDQALKGALVGAASFFLAKINIDPGAQAVLMPLLITGMAYASTKIGDPSTASFLAKAAKEAPAVIEEVTAKAAVAKKAPAKKAAPKK
jgi:hypothetical protein